MMTVNEVARMSGVSIRTLHYYDEIGLLHPDEVTEAGYRMYDDTSLERLQQILLFRELEFPLKDIIGFLNSESFDRDKALNQQIELLTLKKEHLENLIDFARGIKKQGGTDMDFKAFDKSQIDDYKRRAKEQWGDTDAYKESEQKDAGRTDAQRGALIADLMNIFAEFGTIKSGDPAGEAAQAKVKELQDFITANYYNCTKVILSQLGLMYTTDEFKKNIDAAGGVGCADFASKAIEIYCK